jgi:hypothetical protein
MCLTDYRSFAGLSCSGPMLPQISAPVTHRGLLGVCPAPTGGILQQARPRAELRIVVSPPWV